MNKSHGKGFKQSRVSFLLCKALPKSQAKSITVLSHHRNLPLGFGCAGAAWKTQTPIHSVAEAIQDMKVFSEEEIAR